MEIKEFYVNKTLFKAISLDLCDSSQLLMITSPKGYIMCGYLNINTAQKRGDVACIVTGVKTVDDVLNSNVVAVTSNAQKLGIEMGMPVKQVLEKLS